MANILAISGSLRKDSLNTKLAHAAVANAPADVNIDIATLHGIPLYDGDEEAANGIPAAVTALREKILACDGLLLVTPEYNNGMPGVFKNAIDWLSRAGMKEIFANRHVALMGASPSGFGTLLSQTNWLPTLKYLGCIVHSTTTVMVSKAPEAFAADGTLTDERALTALKAHLAAFAAELA